MSGFFARMGARAGGTEAGLRPRPGSRFEPRGTTASSAAWSADPGEDSGWADALVLPGDLVHDHVPGPAARAEAGRFTAEVDRTSTPRTHVKRPQTRPTDASGSPTQERSHQAPQQQGRAPRSSHSSARVGATDPERRAHDHAGGPPTVGSESPVAVSPVAASVMGPNHAVAPPTPGIAEEPLQPPEPDRSPSPLSSASRGGNAGPARPVLTPVAGAGSGPDERAEVGGSTELSPADLLPADLLPDYVLPALIERGLVPPGTPVDWSDAGPGQAVVPGGPDRGRVRVGGPAGRPGVTAGRRGDVVEVRIDRVEIVPPTPAAEPEPGPALPAVDHSAYRARRREGRR